MGFDRFMEGIDISKYLTDVLKNWTGRSRYNPVDMLKTVLCAFATKDTALCANWLIIAK